MPVEQRGQYALEQQVAEGSTGVVWRARHVELGSLAAVKVLKPALYEDPTVRARFLQEARTLAGLDHPGIVQVLDVGEDWIALEWVQGAPLDDVLAAHGPLAPQQAVAVIRGALLGLEQAHAMGVVHGDVATSNVLLSDSGSSMLVDFGLSCPIGAAGICGTPAFVSPEGASAERLTTASDVWSAASVLYLLLSGVPVLPAADVEAVLQRHRYEPVPALSKHGSHLATVLAKAMSFAPLDRYPEGGAFLRALDEAAERQWGVGWLAGAGLAGLSTSVTGGTAPAAASPGTSAAVDTGSIPPSPPTSAPPPRKRPRIPKAPAVAAVAVIVVVAIVVATRHQSTPKPTANVGPLTNVPSSVPLPTKGGTSPTPEGALASAGESGDTYYVARLACPSGGQVSSASTTVGNHGTTTEVPMMFMGTDVWLADLTSFGFVNAEPDLAAHGTCGESTPAPQQEQLRMAGLAVQVEPNPTGTLTTLHVTAKKENPGEQVCPFDAPARSIFWVHGYAPADDPTGFLGGWELSKLPGMETTELPELGVNVFGTTVNAASYGEETSRSEEGKVYTEAQYGYCDFTRTPPA